MARRNVVIRPYVRKIRKSELPKFEVNTEIFETDLLPGRPVIQQLPLRHRRLLCPENVSSANDNDEENTQRSQAEKQKIKDARTFLYLGPHGTIISKLEFRTICWRSAHTITRSLLAFFFDEETLATHLPKGYPTRFQKSAEPKHILPPKIVDDIIYFAKKRFSTRGRDVRFEIAAICAKMARRSNQRIVENN